MRVGPAAAGLAKSQRTSSRVGYKAERAERETWGVKNSWEGGCLAVQSPEEDVRGLT